MHVNYCIIYAGYGTDGTHTGLHSATLFPGSNQIPLVSPPKQLFSEVVHICSPMGNPLHSRTEHRIFVKDTEKPGATAVSTLLEIVELGDFGKKQREITRNKA